MFVPMIVLFVVGVGMYVLAGRSFEAMLRLGIVALFGGLAGVLTGLEQGNEAVLFTSLLFLLLAVMCFHQCHKLRLPDQPDRETSAQ